MLDKFFESFSGKLGETWLQVLLKPAFFFWVGGLGAWASHGSHWQTLKISIAGLPLTGKVAILVIGFLLVQISESFAKLIVFPVTRFLEGYWPNQLNRIRNWRVSHWNAIRVRTENSFQELQKKLTAKTLPFADRDRLVRDEKELRSYPSDPWDWMPTRFGNLLRAAEKRPKEKYGLDAVVCWPRFWLLLPDGAKNDLVEARSALNRAIIAWFWSLVFFVWTIWSWWAVPVSLAGLWLSYQCVLNAADVYGDLVESVFDVHRLILYKSLRWEVPANAHEEREAGGKITQYIWRGSDDVATKFAP